MFSETTSFSFLMKNMQVLSMKAGHWTSLYDALEDAATKDVLESKGVFSIQTVNRIEVASESHPAELEVVKEAGTVLFQGYFEVSINFKAWFLELVFSFSTRTSVPRLGRIPQNSS
jgi:hypothetical protein